MTSEHERWAEALAISRRYGGDAKQHIAERMTNLVKAGDLAGIARWREIAARYDLLFSGTLQ
ncbi:hypothetical protein ASE75_13715 [Sphingomonas sp. Leaf17]|uniref:DUF6961 family protein n=1 Tax=Sphingomonas sp. Leaf17 TaxID=1735683 RepID=UPI0006F33BA8|nr:hypothetical protein ASE75_13715 [Sphingomonas sp. Leaf17]